MTYEASTPEEYINQLPEERREPVARLRQAILDNLPDGFVETVAYGMISYVVPHSIYPAGYHVNPKQPVPYMAIASQKRHIAFYHMGVYGKPELMAWLEAEYPKRARGKLDKGKSCIRFNRMEDIPYGLVGELAGKMTVQAYLNLYEQQRLAGRRPAGA